jgi:hypothetical protein
MKEAHEKASKFWRLRSLLGYKIMVKVTMSMSMPWRCIQEGDLQLHSFLTSVLHGGELSTSCTIHSRYFGEEADVLPLLWFKPVAYPRVLYHALYKQESTFIRTTNSTPELQNALYNTAHHNTQNNHDADVSFWAPLQMKGFPEAECTTELQPKYPCFCYSTLTTIILDSLPRIYCVYTICCLCYLSQLCYCSHTGFVMLSSQSSFVICTSVFDILQIPFERSQICSGCSAPTCTLLAMGLGPKQSISNIKLHNRDILVNCSVMSQFIVPLGCHTAHNISAWSVQD